MLGPHTETQDLRRPATQPRAAIEHPDGPRHFELAYRSADRGLQHPVLDGNLKALDQLHRKQSTPLHRLEVMILQRASAGAHTPAALASGFGEAFWWSAAFTAAAVPLCLLLPGRPSPEPQAQGATPAGRGRAARRGHQPPR